VYGGEEKPNRGLLPSALAGNLEPGTVKRMKCRVGPAFGVSAKEYGAPINIPGAYKNDSSSLHGKPGKEHSDVPAG
jgi:hypothetical protein